MKSLVRLACFDDTVALYLEVRKVLRVDITHDMEDLHLRKK